MTRCRLCRQPLTSDALWAQTGEPPLEVHVRCTHAFLREAAFVFFVAAYDARDDATADRWVEVREHLIALDPPAHVEQLLMTLHLDGSEPTP
jgi:hypothetical protein